MSDYRISRITKNKVDSIQDMLAPEVVDAIKNDLPATALAVVDGDEAVGALSGAVDGDTFEIVSLYVAPEKRRKGAATALMKKLFSFLDEEKLSVRAEYTPADNEAKTLKPFFRSLDFTREEMTFPVYCLINADQFNVDYRSLPGSMSSIESFSEASRKVLASYGLNKDAKLLGPSELLVDENVNENMSFVTVEKSKVRACLITEKYLRGSVKMTPYWFEEPDSKDVGDMKVMLYYAFDEVRKTYAPQTQVVMMVLDPDSGDIVDEFFGQNANVTESFLKTHYEEI